MKVLTLAAGFAAGYVLGTRAGRDKYEQIAATARKLSSHPTVVDAQDKAKAFIGTATDTVAAKLNNSDAEATTVLPATTTQPRPRRPQATTPVFPESPA